jgi:hypothetical protein
VATVKAKKVGPDSVQLTVPIPVSPDGTAGRKCPECRRYFKVDGKRLASTATLSCAYCGATGQKDRFLTLDQRRRLRSAAAKWAYSEVHRMISGVFGTGRSIDAGLVKVSFEVGRAETIPLLSYVERETGRLLTCNSCGALSASYGIAIFCPFCGRRDSRETFAQSIRAARTALETVSTLGMEARLQLQASGGEDRLVENVLGDAVTAFEFYCRAVYSEHAGESALTALLNARGRNVFQRLDDAVDIIGILLNRDLTPTLETPDWTALRLAFATRHVLTHNFGLADVQFVRTTASGVVGHRVQVTRTFAERTLTRVERLANAMA